VSERAPRALRVGLLIDRWDARRGGAERALADLAAHLERRGHEVVVVARQASGGAPGRWMRVHLGHSPRWLLRAERERALAGALVEAAERAGCDVTLGIRHLPRVDVFWPHGGAHSASIAARARARGRRLGSLSAHQRLFLELEERLCAGSGARAVVCVSELVRRELEELYPAVRQRLIVVPNGVDLAHFRLHEEQRARPPRIAFLARDPLLKGLPAMCAALAGLLDRPWHLIVGGVRRPVHWSALARRAGLPASRVEVHAQLDAAELLATATLCALPTWRDSAGLVILEALASGTPVVTTRAAGEAQTVERSGAGAVLEDPGDVAGLRAALAAQLEREPDRRALRRAVEGRDRQAWLERMEAILVDAARAHSERRSLGACGSSGSVAF
jgi:UDP-glucose:(heptosyl)LPS alpha-1,3-glucosyltransferase